MLLMAQYCEMKLLSIVFQAVPKSNTPPGKWEGLTGVLILSVTAAVIGSSTQFGFNTGVINNPKQVYAHQHTHTHTEVTASQTSTFNRSH